jgi:5-methylcytosine-specific restriction endonuclease McrBC GTP-binding regulatory subunit McrB
MTHLYMWIFPIYKPIVLFYLNIQETFLCMRALCLSQKFINHYRQLRKNLLSHIKSSRVTIFTIKSQQAGMNKRSIFGLILSKRTIKGE